MSSIVDTFKAWCENVRRESIAGHLRNIHVFKLSADRDLSAAAMFAVGTIELELYVWETGNAEAHWADMSTDAVESVEYRFCEKPDELIDFLDDVTADLLRL